MFQNSVQAPFLWSQEKVKVKVTTNGPNIQTVHVFLVDIAPWIEVES